MKTIKNYLFLANMIICQVVFSQQVVTAPDVTAAVSAQSSSQTANHASTFAKITAQLAKMEELNKMYDETMKYVKVVNSLVANANQVIVIKKDMEGIITEYKSSVLIIQNEPLIDAPSKQYYLKGLSVTLDESLSVYADIFSILSEDMIMNDSERLNALTRIQTQLSEQRRFIHYLNNKIKAGIEIKKQKIKNSNFINNENREILTKKP